MSRSPAGRSRSRDFQLPENNYIGQDSLALSAYLRLRREHRFTSPPLGGAQSVQSDRTRPYSYFDQPSSEETPQTPMPIINRIDVSQEAVSEAMLAVLDISEQLDFTDEDAVTNVDVTGMRLLLQTALRDKEILRRKLLDMQLTVENAGKERQEALDHSQMITSLTDSSRKWRLPSFITHIFTRYEHNSKVKYLNLWKSKLHAFHVSIYHDHGRRLTLQLARRNILHARLTSIHSFFLRWKTNFITHDLLSAAKGPILHDMIIKRMKKVIFQLLLSASKRKKALRRVINNLQVTYHRRVFAHWQLYLRYRTLEVVLYSHRLLRLALVNRITSSLHLSTHKAWQIWLKYTLHHRLIEQRREKLCLVIKRLLRPEVLAFRKWKLKTCIWYPQQRKVRRFFAILQQSVVIDRLRSSFQRWQRIIQRRTNTCRRILILLQRREIHSLFRAWRTWSSWILAQRGTEVKKIGNSLKQEKIKLTLSLLLLRATHMTHKAFHTWRQFTVHTSHHQQHQSVLFDVDSALQALRAELSLANSARLQAQHQYNMLRQTQQNTSFTQSLKVLIINLTKYHKQHVLRAFQTWKHQLQLMTVTFTFNSHYHSLHKRNVYQSFQFLEKKTLISKYRQVFQTWKLSNRRLKMTRKVINKWQHSLYSQAFDTWKSHLTKKDNNTKKLKNVLIKWMKLKLHHAWYAWKNNIKTTEKVKLLLSKLIKNMFKLALRFAWKQMKNVIHYNQLYFIHTIATQQRSDLERMEMRVYWNKLKIFTSTIKISKLLLKNVFCLIAAQLVDRGRGLFMRWKQKTLKRSRLLSGVKIIRTVLSKHEKQLKHMVFSCLKAFLVDTQKTENYELQTTLSQLGSQLKSIVKDQLQLEQQHSSLTQGNNNLEEKLRQQMETAVDVMYRKAKRTVKHRLFRTWQFYVVQQQKQQQFTQKCQHYTKREALNHWKDVFKIIQLHKSRRLQHSQLQATFNLKNLLLQWRLMNQHFKHAKIVFLSLLKRRQLNEENSAKSRRFYRWCALTPMMTLKAQTLLPLFEHWQHVVVMNKMRKKKVKKMILKKLMGLRRLGMDRWTQSMLQQRCLQHKLTVIMRTLRKLRSYHISIHLHYAFSTWITLCQEQSLVAMKHRKLSKVIRNWQNQLVWTAWKQWFSFVRCESKKSRGLKLILHRVDLTFTSMLKFKFARWKYQTLLDRQHDINLQHRLVQYTEQKQTKLLRKVFAVWFQIIKQRGAIFLNGLQSDYEYFTKEISKHNSALFACDNIVKSLHCADQALASLLKGSGYAAQVFHLRSLLDSVDQSQYIGLSSRHHATANSTVKSKKGGVAVSAPVSAWQSPLSTSRRYPVVAAATPAFKSNTQVNNESFEPFSPAGRTTIRTPFDMHTSYHHQHDHEDVQQVEEEALLDVYLMGEGLVGQCAASGTILQYHHPYSADDEESNNSKGLAVLCVPLFHSGNSHEAGRVTAVLQIIHECTITSPFDLLLARDRLASPSPQQSTKSMSNKYTFKSGKLQQGQVLDSILALRLSIPLTLALLSFSSSLSLVVPRLHNGEVQKDIHEQERDQATITLQQLQQEHEHLQLQRDLENSHSERLQQQLNDQQRSHQQMLALMEKLKVSRQKYKELSMQSTQQALTFTSEKEVMSAELEKQKEEVTKLKQVMQKYHEQKQQIASLNKILRTAAQDLLK